MQLAILTNMKVNSGIKFYPENEPPKYCIFYVTSIFPDKKGVYFKASCRATGFSCEQVKALKLHQNSLVNIEAEMSQYTKVDKIETTFEVLNISIVSEIFEKPEEVKKETNEEKQRNFLNKLASDPFKRGERNGFK